MPQPDSLPLVVAVTGHRDLVASETEPLRQKVRKFFLELAERFPARRLRLLSPLAEGADQLVAEIAVDLDIELVVPLPMDEFSKDVLYCLHNFFNFLFSKVSSSLHWLKFAKRCSF